MPIFEAPSLEMAKEANNTIYNEIKKPPYTAYILYMFSITSLFGWLGVHKFIRNSIQLMWRPQNPCHLFRLHFWVLIARLSKALLLLAWVVDGCCHQGPSLHKTPSCQRLGVPTLKRCSQSRLDARLLASEAQCCSSKAKSEHGNQH